MRQPISQLAINQVRRRHTEHHAQEGAGQAGEGEEDKILGKSHAVHHGDQLLGAIEVGRNARAGHQRMDQRQRLVLDQSGGGHCLVNVQLLDDIDSLGGEGDAVNEVRSVLSNVWDGLDQDEKMTTMEAKDKEWLDCSGQERRILSRCGREKAGVLNLCCLEDCKATSVLLSKASTSELQSNSRPTTTAELHQTAHLLLGRPGRHGSKQPS
jgi:hypothetical protein